MLISSPIYHGFRQTRIETDPDFGAAPRAVGMFPTGVVKFTGQRRDEAFPHIAFSYAIFVPIRHDILKPVFVQNFFVNRFWSALIHSFEPDKLQAQIISFFQNSPCHIPIRAFASSTQFKKIFSTSLNTTCCAFSEVILYQITY